MAERTLIRDIYGIETDGTDWPKTSVGPMSDEDKTKIKGAVLDVLDMCMPLSTYDLVQRVKDHPTVQDTPLKGAALWDWIYGCVVRAARAADCEQRWHPPAKPVAPAKPVRDVTKIKRSVQRTLTKAGFKESGDDGPTVTWRDDYKGRGMTVASHLAFVIPGNGARLSGSDIASFERLGFASDAMGTGTIFYLRG